MTTDKIKEGDQLWTMVGSRPIKMEVFSIHSFKSTWCDFMHHTIWLHEAERRTTYTRKPNELFKTYNQLRDYVFPKLWLTFLITCVLMIFIFC